MVARITIFLKCLSFSLLALCFHSQAVGIEKPWLIQGQSEFKNLAERDGHSYQLKLLKGQFVAGVALQKSIN